MNKTFTITLNQKELTFIREAVNHILRLGLNNEELLKLSEKISKIN